MLYASSLCVLHSHLQHARLKEFMRSFGGRFFCADHQTNSLSHALLRPPMGDLEIKPIRNREKTGFPQQSPPLKTLVPRTGPKKTCAVYCLFTFLKPYMRIFPQETMAKKEGRTLPFPFPPPIHFISAATPHSSSFLYPHFFPFHFLMSFAWHEEEEEHVKLSSFFGGIKERWRHRRDTSVGPNRLKNMFVIQSVYFTKISYVWMRYNI